MKIKIPILILIPILVAAFSACNQQKGLSPEEARAIAKEAYIYGFPMVVNYKTMYAFTLDKINPKYKGPFNYLACDARLLTPEDTTIVSPNSDTPECYMWGDLRKEPMVITVPKMEPDRYYSFQLIDLYTHNFAYIGTLSTGNDVGKYMITGSGWKGETPQGIDKAIPCETPLFFIVVRTQLFDPDDLKRVKEIQDAYKVETLSEYLGDEPGAGAESINTPKWNEGVQFTAAMFPYMNAMMNIVEPFPEEKELMERFAKLNIGKGKTFNLNDFDPGIQKAIEEGVDEGFSDMENFTKKMNSDPIISAKIVGTRKFLMQSAKENYQMDNFYLIRAAAAYIGLYANSGEEAVYPIYLMDADGNPLNASTNNYTITFPDGQLPPVKAFWSLTMYDGKTQQMINNPLNRYLLNSSMQKGFVYNKDGSLTFYIQKDSPGKSLENNWLPAPDGSFDCIWRLYGPEESVLNGEWVNPPMEIAKD
ncbi:MAG: cell envelope protein [Marinilabiliales bacterium]|nr:MAG: cell envelope protein [Marinilabiliales bacterium]